MKTHELKTDPIVFNATFKGLKPYEIRLNDRNYEVGDLLILRETLYSGDEIKEGKPLIYTGRTIKRKITYILTGYALKDNWCVLSVIPTDKR